MIRLQSLCLVLIFALLVALLPFGAEHTQASNNPKRVRIIYTNDTLGYLEPCGCGGRYLGGFARRSTAIVDQTKEYPDTIIVDSGNLTDTVSKMALITTFMAGMKYDAVGVGGTDLAHLDEFLKQTSANGLKVVDATRPETKSVLPYLIKKVGGIKVGIISYGRAYSREDAPADKGRFISAYKAARKSSEVLILLDQGAIATQEWLQGEGSKLGTPDIVIGGAANAKLTEEQIVGKTHIVPTSWMGKQIGVIDVEIASNGQITMKQQAIPIDSGVKEDDSIKKQITDFVLKPIPLTAETLAATGASPIGSTQFGKGAYYSPETCKDCHSDEYKQWSKTKHATAMNTLFDKNRTIPGCLPCHSEEFRQTLKITRQPQTTPSGIECATCHASVLPHGESGPAKSSVRKVDHKLCLTCHNTERSPDYEAKTYMQKVLHTSLK
ncbi:MAG: multiheme c-type cytochrome [Armatimonadetes bacterium]|nr:multiheme c-type cytochrome [Armatimonadota bacterium]